LTNQIDWAKHPSFQTLRNGSREKRRKVGR